MVAAPCTPMQPNVGGALIASESITSLLLMKSLSQNSPGTGFADKVFALSSRGYAAARTRSRAGDASCRPWRMRRRLSCRILCLFQIAETLTNGLRIAP